nr:ArdC protein [uncultured bacterium]
MTHQLQIQIQKPAQASSKAMFQSQNNPKAEIQQKALSNAVTGESFANYQAIFDGFAAMGIDMADVEPRVNVFTFNAWKALGRVVKKGQHGVKIVTVVPCTKKDRETGDEVAVKKVKTTTVFHVSQTEEIGGEPTDKKASADTVAEETAAPEAAQEAAEQPAAQAVAVIEQAEPTEAEEPRELNAYEARIAAKRERYEERASKAQDESRAIYSRARKMAEVIPFGQPILVGHHSEGRDRNYRNRIHNTFGKAFAAQDKAEHYAQKAATVGTGGISSDDPDAVKKLRAELASAEKSQELMKAANKAIRANKTPETQTAALVALGFTEAQAVEAIKPDFARRVGFPAYALSNNNANMARIKGRIAELEKRSQRADVEQAGDGFTYREDTTENRVMFIFDGKPDEATRAILKREAFKWSPSRGAWVRQLNNAGIWAGKQVLERFNVAKIGDAR